jgi:transcriptional regulator with XRE-family HTH domain
MTGSVFGWALRALRRKHHLPQTELAARAATDQRYISELETGFKTGPTEQMIFRLAIALKANLREADLLRIARGFQPLTSDWQDLTVDELPSLLRDLEKGNLG